MSQLVIIDPGHGWGDPGATRAGVCEADIALGIAEYLAAELRALGQTCLQTRQRADRDILNQARGLVRRARMANEVVGAACFVSLHLNSMPEEEGGSGIEVYYQAESLKGITLGRAIEAAYNLDTIIPRRLPMVKPHTSLYVLRKTRMPAVLVECGFITNTKEREFLNREGGRCQMATTLARGIVNWLTGKDGLWRPKSFNSASSISQKATSYNG